MMVTLQCFQQHEGTVLVAQHENWAQYVQRVTAGLKRNEVIAATGVDASGLSRWFSGKRPSAESAVKFARGISQSPIEALIAAGYLQPSEATGVIEVTRSRSELSDTELLIERGERLAERAPRPEVDDTTPRLARPDDAGEGVKNGHGLC